MTGHIYLIRNSMNGKGYIGQTIRPIGQRFDLHKSKARTGSDYVLHQAMRKYGFDNFSIIEIVTCDALLLNCLEQYFIQFFGTFISNGHGYNLTCGGDSNHSLSALTKAKMAAAKLGKKRGPFSVEHRKNMSRAMLGNVNGRGGKGRKHSDDSKRKISLTKKSRINL